MQTYSYVKTEKLLYDSMAMLAVALNRAMTEQVMRDDERTEIAAILAAYKERK